MRGIRHRRAHSHLHPSTRVDQGKFAVQQHSRFLTRFAHRKRKSDSFACPVSMNSRSPSQQRCLRWSSTVSFQPHSWSRFCVRGKGWRCFALARRRQGRRARRHCVAAAGAGGWLALSDGTAGADERRSRRTAVRAAGPSSSRWWQAAARHRRRVGGKLVLLVGIAVSFTCCVGCGAFCLTTLIPGQRE